MIGEILDFKYRLERELGAGGMGNVYLATHLGTTRVVAVKIIAPRWAADPQFLHRFQREAQACGRLRHPNIVNVTDFGIAQAAGAHVPYLVMEYLDGETLSSYRKSQPNLPLVKISDILDQVGLALTEAHRYEIVHRDLKPDNIWLEPNGRGGHTVKVLDFGVAKMNVPSGHYAVAAPAAGYDAMQAAEPFASAPGSYPEANTFGSGAFDASEDAKTLPGSLLGTPAYMSPEQALGREIDYRSDIYSLAVVAYLLVCGRLPFEGQSHELFAYHFSGATVPPRKIRPMPRDVSDAILAGLARDPALRPPTATAFTRRLHNAADAESSALRLSKAFVMEHAGTFAALFVPGWFGVLIVLALIGEIAKNIPASPAVRNGFFGLMAIPVVIFSDNLMRATAALVALEHRSNPSGFLSFRVAWRLLLLSPQLVKTQAAAVFEFDRGWLVRDCLWPVIAVIERVSGMTAILRSRAYLSGINSAAWALALRHLVPPLFVFAQTITAMRLGSPVEQLQNRMLYAFFLTPFFVVVAAAPLALYDRTSENPIGPLAVPDVSRDDDFRRFPISWGTVVWLLVPLLIWLAGESTAISQAFSGFVDK